jgi:hypothetical protein
MLGYQMDPRMMAAFGMGGGQEAKDGGFVITIAGYCPYKDVGELLDPVGVDDKPNKWGIVTRLTNLAKILDKSMIVDGNSPLELYKKTDIQHFKIEKGPVDLNAEMPAGIGVLEPVNRGAPGAPGGGFEGGGRPYDPSGANILADPMTRETICTVPVLDEYGRQRFNSKNEPLTSINDSWFVLNFKLKWRDAPKSFVTAARPPTTGAAVSAPASTTSTTTSSSSTTATRKRSARKGGVDFGGE